MTVEQTDVIDGTGVSQDGATAVFMISDHLPWDDSTHFYHLTAKIEAYAEFILSGAALAQFPQYEGKATVIEIVFQHEPSVAATSILVEVQQQLKEAGLGLSYGLLPAGY
jgi:hypothetical protein